MNPVVIGPAAVWVGVTVTGLAVTTYLAGRSDNKEKRGCEDEEDLIVARCFIAVFWPVVIVIAVIAAPFWFLYKLGQRKGQSL